MEVKCGRLASTWDWNPVFRDARTTPKREDVGLCQERLGYEGLSQHRFVNRWDKVGVEVTLGNVAIGSGRKRRVNKFDALMNGYKYDLGSAMSRLELFGGLESI
jgi:hypothetical protein